MSILGSASRWGLPPPQPPLLEPGAARSDGSKGGVCSKGCVLISIGAFFYATTNAASTGLFRRGGTVVTLYLVRAVVVFTANALIAAVRDGRAEAGRVLRLRTGRTATTWMVTMRSLITTAMALLLNLSFLYLTYNDAFTIFKGVDMLTTALLTAGSSSERLSPAELACGALTLCGIVLVAQPPMLMAPIKEALGLGEVADEWASPDLPAPGARPPATAAPARSLALSPQLLTSGDGHLLSPLFPTSSPPPSRPPLRR